MCLPVCGLLSFTVILIGLATADAASAGTADKTALLTSHPANNEGGRGPICTQPYKWKYDIIFFILFLLFLCVM